MSKKNPKTPEEAEKKVASKIPKTIAECADLLFKTKAERLKQQKVVDSLEADEVALREHIIQNLPKSNATGIAGKLARVTVSNKEVVQIEDWPAFYKYIKKHDAFDLMQRRCAPQAIEARLEAKVKIPGVKLFTVPVVSINKV